jgi:uncharacterized repeat protein (TIGR03803 family)
MPHHSRCPIFTLATTGLVVLLFLGYAAAQKETVLYSFTGGSDGGIPYANLVADTKGNLYGTTQQYGDGPCNFPSVGCGTVFELMPGQGGQWTFRLLYSFQGGDDGANPSAGLAFDDDGNLYGTTFWGGSTKSEDCGGSGCGTVFELQRSRGWKETILYRFGRGADGGNPSGSVVAGQGGALFGTTSYGGDLNCFYEGPGCGVVFELQPAADAVDGWRETVLHTFEGADGADPYVGVTLDGAGNIYGVTALGGLGQSGFSGGVVFGLQRSESGWNESTLYEFPEYYGNPAGPLVLDNQENLYGTTEVGGEWEAGSVFELQKGGLATTAQGWTKTDLYDFLGGPTGSSPLFSGVVFDSRGNLYGTTENGGMGDCQGGGCGTVFELSKGPMGIWEERGLFSFPGGTGGSYPFSGVTLDGKGHLYGMTPNGGDPSCQGYWFPGCGVIYEISK